MVNIIRFLTCLNLCFFWGVGGGGGEGGCKIYHGFVRLSVMEEREYVPLFL